MIKVEVTTDAKPVYGVDDPYYHEGEFPAAIAALPRVGDFIEDSLGKLYQIDKVIFVGDGVRLETSRVFGT